MRSKRSWGLGLFLVTFLSLAALGEQKEFTAAQKRWWAFQKVSKPPVPAVKNIAWVRGFYQATAPYSEEGAYVNFLSGDDQGRIRANYKGNYDRLVEIKRKYDPDNIFRVNQNIQP